MIAIHNYTMDRFRPKMDFRATYLTPHGYHRYEATARHVA
jgi:hypothetical protein